MLRRWLCGLNIVPHEVEIRRQTTALFEVVCRDCGLHRWGSVNAEGPLLPWTPRIEVIFRRSARPQTPAHTPTPAGRGTRGGRE